MSDDIKELTKAINTLVNSVEVPREKSEKKSNFDIVSVVRETLKQIGFDLDISTGEYIKLKEERYNKYTLDHITFEIRRWMRSKNSSFLISKEDIRDTLKHIIDIEVKNNVKKCMKNISYNPKSTDTTEDLCRLLTGHNYHPIYPSILKQWMYQVKNRSRERNVKMPIMMLFYGGYGLGKSTFIKRFLSPLPVSIVNSTNQGDKVFNDESYQRTLVDYSVIFIDEMSGMKEAALDKLKTTIDMDLLNIRGYYTQLFSSEKLRGSFIGSTNDMVNTIIHSTNNIRKYCQINYFDPRNEIETDNSTELEKYTRSICEKVWSWDFVNLWRNVNEDGPEPFSDEKVYSDYLKYVAETCKSSDRYTQWMKSILSKLKVGDKFNKGDLEKVYNEWVSLNKITKAKGFDKIFNEFKQHPCLKYPVKVDGYWYFKLIKEISDKDYQDPEFFVEDNIEDVPVDNKEGDKEVPETTETTEETAESRNDLSEIYSDENIQRERELEEKRQQEINEINARQKKVKEMNKRR